METVQPDANQLRDQSTNQSNNRSNNQPNNQTNNQSTKGFGSFQSTSIEYLIRQSKADYKPPHIPVDVSTLNRQAAVSSLNQQEYHSDNGLINGSAISSISLSNNHSQNNNQSIIPLPEDVVSWPADHYRSLWSLDRAFTFINHGAFGASVSALQSINQSWIARFESQPLRFIDRELLPLIAHTVRLVADYLQVQPTNVVLADNVTTVMSCIMRSFERHHYKHVMNNQPSQYTGPHHTILYTNLAYGSVKKLLIELSERTGTRLCEVAIDFPCSEQSICQSIKQSINQCLVNGKPVSVAFFDHITSNTAVKLPINQLIQLCRDQSIITVIDGAHGPFNVHPLNLSNNQSIDQSNNQTVAQNQTIIDADFYTGNFHKWLSNPKGAAFLFVNDRILNNHSIKLEPPTISHGFKSGMHSEWAWTGTHSYSAQLSVISCLQMWLHEGLIKPSITRQANHSSVSINQARSYCLSLCKWARSMLLDRWDSMRHVLTDDNDLLECCMTCVPLPLFKETNKESVKQLIDGDAIQSALYHRYAIECPIKTINHHFYARISCHVYNQPNDYLKLADAVMEMWNNRSLIA